MENSMLLSVIVSRVCELARIVGEYLREERRIFDISRIEYKGAHDYVSYVDRESEYRIVEGLATLIPGAGYITEENIAAYNGEEYYWIIDPLDGTTNYLHDKSPYAVSIALGHIKDGILAGVVYDVCRRECFYAWKDGGAYIDDKPISLTGNVDFDAAYVHVGLPYDAERYNNITVSLLQRLYGRVGAVRICGSAAMDISNVAAGRVDAYVEPGLRIWDIAAGVIILCESGGVITDFCGNSLLSGDIVPETWREMRFDVLAVNRSLHGTFLRLLS